MQETVWIISDTGRLIQRTADAVNNTASVFAQVMSLAGRVAKRPPVAKTEDSGRPHQRRAG